MPFLGQEKHAQILLFCPNYHCIACIYIYSDGSYGIKFVGCMTMQVKIFLCVKLTLTHQVSKALFTLHICTSGAGLEQSDLCINSLKWFPNRFNQTTSGCGLKVI